MTIVKRWIKIGLGVICLTFIAVSSAQAKEQLTLWIHPYLPATKLMQKFTPLVEYLAEQCDLDINIRISTDYKTHIEKIGRNHVDFAYMGPAPYVKMTQKYGTKPLLAGLEVNGKPYYSGMIIVRTDSPIKELADLRGKKFAFGDPNSTMNHLVPHFMLREAGLKDDDFAEFAFLGSHSNIALGVLGGYYDAGGVKEAIFYQYENRGLRMLAQSPAIVEHVFVASDTLAKPMVEKLRRAFLDLKDPMVLTSIKKSVTGMVLVQEDDFDSLRLILSQYDKHDDQ